MRSALEVTEEMAVAALEAVTPEVLFDGTAIKVMLEAALAAQKPPEGPWKVREFPKDSTIVEAFGSWFRMEISPDDPRNIDTIRVTSTGRILQWVSRVPTGMTYKR